MFFFRRKSRRSDQDLGDVPHALTPVEMMAEIAERGSAYEEGVIPCIQCDVRLPLKKLEPLSMVECPQCHRINFVPLQIGRYWLFEPLGGGGMGSVYKALHRDVAEQMFAVKVLSREEKAKPANIYALLNEARIGQIIGDHPCLVKFVDSGCENGEYYAAMELVQGERLDKRVDRMGRMQEPQVLELALHILAAEQHVYRCGYLYRDMKPENIIINTEGYAILFDYGLCITRDQALHADDEYVSGSPYYLPPERLLGTGEDAYSEIYSIGMVMYYALSGQTYFDAQEVEALAKRHISKMRLPVSAKLRNMRSELVDVLSKMIKQEPGERYQSFHEVSQAIRGLADIAPS